MHRAIMMFDEIAHRLDVALAVGLLGQIDEELDEFPLLRTVDLDLVRNSPQESLVDKVPRLQICRKDE